MTCRRTQRFYFTNPETAVGCYDSDYVSTKIGMYMNTGRHYIGSSVSVGHTCDKLQAYSRDGLLMLWLPSIIDAALQLHIDQLFIWQRKKRFRARGRRDGRRIQWRITVISCDRVHACKHKSSSCSPETLHLTSDCETTYLHHALLFTIKDNC